MTLSRRQKVIIILLVFYWPTLFILAHIPVPQLVRRADVSDKSLHFLAYLVLVFLLWFAMSSGKKVIWRKAAVWWVFFVLTVYGIVDELLQGFVGRNCDVMDVIANLTGTLTGLLAFSVFTFWPAALLVTGTVIFGITNIANANLAELMPVPNAMFHLFAYAIFTMLWIRYMHLFLSLKTAKLKWLIAALAAPTVLLLTVKLFSVILGKYFTIPDMLVSVGAIAAVIAAIYLRKESQGLTALFRSPKDALRRNQDIKAE